MSAKGGGPQPSPYGSMPSQPNPYASLGSGFFGAPTWGRSPVTRTATALLRSAATIGAGLQGGGNYFGGNYFGGGFGGAPQPAPPAGALPGGFIPDYARYGGGFEQIAADRIRQLMYAGRNAYAFTVNPGDVLSWDSQNGSPPAQRAELRYTYGASAQKANSPYNAVPGEHTGYNWSVNFDQQFPDTQKWATLLQFHPPDGGQWGFAGVSINGDKLIIRKPGTEDLLWSAPVQKGQWYDFDFDIDWSSGSDGRIRAWLNGQPIVNYTGWNIAPGQDYSYIKQGYYRSGTVAQPGTVYQTPVRLYEGGLPPR